MKARNTSDEMLAVVQAHKEGKQIQYWYSQDGNFFETGTWEDCAGNPVFNFGCYIYRVKPEPKKVPLAYADIPLDRPVWITSQLKDVEQVIGVDKLGVTTHRSWTPFDGMQHVSITFDGGKTWKPCWKEVVE